VRTRTLAPLPHPPAAAATKANPERQAALTERSLKRQMTTEKEIQNSDELLAKIRSAFKSAFDIDPQSVTLNTVPSDISAWDSMGHVTLASSLEQAFGLTFDVDDLMAMENVKEIHRIVHSKLGQVQSA
jgi:acyl carrier protein